MFAIEPIKYESNRNISKPTGGLHSCKCVKNKKLIKIKNYFKIKKKNVSIIKKTNLKIFNLFATEPLQYGGLYSYKGVKNKKN